MLNINNIKAETLAKLTSDEIGKLDLLNYGVMTYKGTLKTKRNGYKVCKISEIATNFVDKNNEWIYEFIRIQSDPNSEENHYAMRIYNVERGEYIEFCAPMIGIDFLRF